MRRIYFLLAAALFLNSFAANSQLIISEFRVRGPNGANDEYIEIYNNNSSDHTVAGGGIGYAVVASDGTTRFIIPNGTVIPSGGHYLGVNSVGYSLASYPAGNGTTATGDATYTTDIADNAGIAIFNTSIPGNFSLITRMDAVGSTSEANTLYKEGTGYPAIVPFSINYCFHRKIDTGRPLDTNNNANDFKFEDTNGTSAGAGQSLGAPGPENLSSPLGRAGGFLVERLDAAAAFNAPPNSVRDFTSDPPNNSTFGTCDVRLKITNNSGGNCTRMRFRITDITTFPSPSGVSDLRPRTSSAVVVTTSSGNVTVQGTTLEQPPSQPNGGGFNSSMSVGVITLGTPLPNGASINVRLLFGIQQTGYMTIGMVMETLPGGSSGAAGSGFGTLTPFRISGSSNGNDFGLINATAAVAGDVIISEFRVRGPNGLNDEFVELYNKTNSNVIIAAADGSSGWALAGSDGNARFIIPNGTLIPPHGHYLGVNSVGYSLSSYPSGNGTTATADATYTTDIADNAGIALFTTSNPVNFTLANRSDAVGSTSEANSLYREGAGYPPLVPFSIDYTFHRKTDAGQPLDNNNNAADFKFEDTNGTSAGAGQSLGAPGPQNLSGPVTAGASLLVTMADPAAAQNVAPNYFRDLTSDPANNSTFGTISLRYKVTNNGTLPVTRLRFRIDSLNTFPSASGIVDLRPRTSSDVVITVPSGTVTARGLTLEQPPSQPNGGGFNSSMSSGIVTVATPLMPGQSMYVNLLMGIQQTGTFNIAITPEVLPNTEEVPQAPLYVRGATCPTITVTNPVVTNGTSGVAFSQTFTQSGGAPTVTFSTASPLPAGITLNSNGTLSGTPTASGSFPIVVTVTDANGCTGTGSTYTLVITDPPCSGGPALTYTNTTPVTIPTTVSTVTSTIFVSGAPKYIYDLNVLTNITHTFSSDLDITITSPSGKVVTLTTDNGGANDNVFAGTTWDDDANPAGQVPYTSNNGVVTDHTYTNLVVATPLTPEEPLGAFIGENPNGLWTITISDDAAADGGTLNSWGLVISGNYTAPTIASGTYSNSTPVTIPTTISTVSSTITVAGAGTSISDVNVLTNILHTFASDLDITLQSPAGTIVTLTTDNGGGNDNVFNGTTWDDSANPGGQVPYTANNGMVTDHTYTNLVTATPLTPEEPLAAFIGENPNGVWTLTISDDAAGDGGTLSSWSLDIKTSTCVPQTCFITCPSNITVSNTVNQCGAVVNYAVPTSTGTCGPLTATPASGSFFPIGNTLVTVQSATGDGYCTFTVKVNDTQAPTVTCPSNITVNAAPGTCSAVVNFSGGSVSDNCPGVISTYSPASGSTFPVGTTTVTRTATDAAGNTATCTFTVTVVDNINPTITCPANITASNGVGVCSASVTTPNPTTADNCSVAKLTWVLTGATTGTSPATGINNVGTRTFNVGVTTVTYTVTDASNNTAVCSFTVTVNDTQLPVITCPGNITVTTPVGSCVATVNYTVTATDNCPGVTTALQSGLASGSAFPIGVNNVTWRATDAAGNISTCSFTVTVNDGQLPVISVQPQSVTSCVGSNATFTVTSSNAVNYQWEQFSGGTWNAISGATTNSFTVSNVQTAMNTNTFRVKVIGLCTTVTSATATLFVNTLPIITLTSSIPPSILPGQFLDITATGIPPGGSYVWLKNGVVLSGVTGNVLSGLGVDDIGSYQVRYTDLNGCVSTSSALVITGLTSGGIWVYPNPNAGQFSVRFFNTPGENATVNVYDARGAKVYSRTIATTLAYSLIDINLGAQTPNGMYVVELVNGSGKRVGAKQILVRNN